MRAAWGYIIAVRTKRNGKIRVSSIIKNILSQRIWSSVILLTPQKHISSSTSKIKNVESPKMFEEDPADFNFTAVSSE